MGRLRASAARDALVSLASSEEPPQAAHDLVDGRIGAPPVPGLFDDPRARGGRAATPRSLDEPKLRWLDERAEMMERLVRASMGGGEPTDLEIVRKIQQSVIASFQGPGDLTPKQWNALYGWGALYGRVLSRSFGGRWTGLADDKPPARWEMLFPWGHVAWPMERIIRLIELGPEEGDLVAQFLDLKARADAAARG
jgi:hypothetical protein